MTVKQFRAQGQARIAMRAVNDWWQAMGENADNWAEEQGTLYEAASRVNSAMLEFYHAACQVWVDAGGEGRLRNVVE